MTACPRCAARFVAAPDIERQWMERHITRHGAVRPAPQGDEADRDHSRLSPAA